jgi:hypothetical protein
MESGIHAVGVVNSADGAHFIVWKRNNWMSDALEHARRPKRLGEFLRNRQIHRGIESELASFVAASTSAGVIGSAAVARACARAGRVSSPACEASAPAATAVSSSRRENRTFLIIPPSRSQTRRFTPRTVCCSAP